MRLQDSGEGRSHRREPEQRLRQDGSERNSESPENEELRKQVKDLQREFESLMSGYNGLQNDRDGLLSRNRHLQKYVKDLQSEVENQKAQIVQYKMEISISTRHGDQVSDDTIRRDAQQIFFAIQNFAARNFRNAQFGEPSKGLSNPDIQLTGHQITRACVILQRRGRRKSFRKRESCRPSSV